MKFHDLFSDILYMMLGYTLCMWSLAKELEKCTSLVHFSHLWLGVDFFFYYCFKIEVVGWFGFAFNTSVLHKIWVSFHCMTLASPLLPGPFFVNQHTSLLPWPTSTTPASHTYSTYFPHWPSNIFTCVTDLFWNGQQLFVHWGPLTTFLLRICITPFRSYVLTCVSLF